MFRKIFMYIILTCSTILMGCAFTTFQSPRTTKPGKAVFGLGVGGGVASGEGAAGVIVETNLYMRVGLTQNLDFGLRNITGYGFAGDLKYQFLQNPDVSFDLGVSYIPVGIIDLHRGLLDIEETEQLYVLYPLLLVGSERLHGGLKMTYWVTRYPETRHSGARTYTTLLPGIMVGAAFGKRFKIMPELNFHVVYSDDEEDQGFVTVVGLGFQF
ncbi:hypothetical protein AMJ87_08275 [candidate division WOR_3 bacterium SM23_60]|uniref:Outer membrane protein beta-barrel domain-containing protein n=1 Tax=candidate division WOR_3 bacterium SM23_60 TaxID=1703780 RepID=A0A0S8GDT7_UNCW3|nr:MAG: hypothetical protein AMJ87_08275 [candidate division WOR_3 bacterium SM23_60]